MADPFEFERPERYAVMGNPVAHSKSPQIHALFAHQFKHRLEYSAIQVDPGGFRQAAEQFRASGGKGLNVTGPFEIDAFRLVDNMSERARIAGAVNAIKFDPDGRVFGDNTDGAGLVRDLNMNLGISLRAQPVLLLGAGAPVRAVLAPILKEAPARVAIAHSTIPKAKELAAEFAALGKIEASSYEDLRGQRFAVVINGSSVSLKGEAPPLPESLLAREALAYEMVYGDRPTLFMDWAALHGAGRVVDGLGMLVEQAAESYFLWKGVRPDTKPVINALRRQG